MVANVIFCFFSALISGAHEILLLDHHVNSDMTDAPRKTLVFDFAVATRKSARTVTLERTQLFDAMTAV